MAAALLAGATLVVLIVWRVRDRIDLRIESIELRGDNVVVHVRNRGNKPTIIGGLLNESDGWMPGTGTSNPQVAGQSRRDVVVPVAGLARDPTGLQGIRVRDGDGKESEMVELPKDVRDAVIEARRITPS